MILQLFTLFFFWFLLLHIEQFSLFNSLLDTLDFYDLLGEKLKWLYSSDFVAEARVLI
jgi:hypothetical protein